MPSYKDPRTGKWYCQFYYEDWTGKKRHKVKRGFIRKRDADEFERNFRSAGHEQEITMDALIDAFIANIRTMEELGSLSKQTANYKILNINARIKPYFQGVIADRVKTVDVDNWLATISKYARKPSKYPEKRKEPVLMSSRTVNNYRSILKQIFDFGKKNYGLQKNPVELSAIIKNRTNDERAKCWALDQYKLFIKTVDSLMYKVAFNILYFAGLRVGELCALRESSIKPYKITVDRSLVHRSAMTQYFKAPKTMRSVRDVEIPKMLYEQIMGYIALAGPFGEEDRIFPFAPQNLNYKLKRAHELLGLPRISPHCLRHSYASNLYHMTNNITLVANAIGHENPRTTLEFYAFALPGCNRAAADALESKMQEIEQSPEY